MRRNQHTIIAAAAAISGIDLSTQTGKIIFLQK
jgi:hypothetical protein